MSEIAEKAAEVVAENVEETIDGVVETLEVVRNNPVALATVGVVGLVAGGVGGYFIAKKRLDALYEDRVAKEVAEAREFYKGLNKVGDDGEVLSPMDVLTQRHGQEAATEALRTYQGRGDESVTEADVIAAAQELQGEPHDDDVDDAQIAKIEASLKETRVESDGTVTKTEVQETRNVFVEPAFDLDEERKYRSPHKPYVISREEHGTAEGYETVTLTYYEDDDTLVGEDDNPVKNVDQTVGDDNLIRFGHGSRDRNVVFVRNEKLQIDYEIHKTDISYLEAIGLGPEPDNSVMAARRREFRHGE